MAKDKGINRQNSHLVAFIGSLGAGQRARLKPGNSAAISPVTIILITVGVTSQAVFRGHTGAGVGKSIATLTICALTMLIIHF
jgi:hypothetical protein